MFIEICIAIIFTCFVVMYLIFDSMQNERANRIAFIRERAQSCERITRHVERARNRVGDN